MRNSKDSLKPDLAPRLRATARLLYAGETGAGNALYAGLIGELSSALDTMAPERRRDALRALQAVLRCQQQEDWVGMADVLEFSLAGAMEQNS